MVKKITNPDFRSDKRISGTKTPAEQAAAIAKAKGPKAGSARASQSVKLSAEDQKQIKDEGASRKATRPDVIKEVKPTEDRAHIAVMANSGQALTFRKGAESAELAKLAAVGASFKALQEYLKTHKPAAKLATGLDGRSAPQSAQAAAESRKAAKDPVAERLLGKVPAKPAPATSTAKSKAVSAKSATPSASRGKGDRTYAATDKADDSRDGTFRKYMITTIRAHKDTGAAKAAHAKSGQHAKDKLNFNWAAQHGYIKFTD